mgnify:FL=1
MVYSIIEGKKYRLDFRGYDIKKQQPTFYGTEEEAIAFQNAQIEQTKMYIKIRLDRSSTVDECIQAYNAQELTAARRSELTFDHVSKKAAHLKHFADVAFEGKRLGDYKVAKLMPKDLKYVGQTYPDPSRKNVAKRFITIKNFFKFCISENVIEDKNDPAKHVKVTTKGERRIAMAKTGKAETKKRRRITVEEMDAIIECASEQYRPHIITGAYSGIRASEQCALQWNDDEEDYIDFEENRIHVAWGVDSLEDKSRIRGTLKTHNADRFVPLATNVRIALREHKMNQPLKLRKENFIFPNKLGGLGYHRTWLRYGLKPACKRAGVKPCTWLDLRHFYASVCIYNTNLDPENIAYYMGHANGEFTQQEYAQWFEHAGRDKQVIEELDAAFAVQGEAA